MSRRITTTTFILCLLCAIMASCHSTKKTSKSSDSSNHQPPTTSTKVHADYSVATFIAEADGTSISGQMRIATDSLLWMNISKVIELARAEATPDSVKIYSVVLGKKFLGNYADLKRQFGISTSFVELQRIALSNNAEASITRMAQAMGYNIQLKITKRETVDRLSFPFQMPVYR
ncbi:MAG: DUF4292 domain-containing protein [Bacteroidales bacterium]|nr:DUF4292 domain-containing protein [Bacteroidales bacterium]